MGVPAHMMLGGQATRGRTPTARKPRTWRASRCSCITIPMRARLMPADQIPSQRMHAFTRPKLDFQLVRMRLNPTDHHHFENYTSGAIYLDFQQGQPQSIFGGDGFAGDHHVQRDFFRGRSAGRWHRRAAQAVRSAAASKGKAGAPAGVPAGAPGCSGAGERVGWGAGGRQFHCRRPSSRNRYRCRGDWARPRSPVSPKDPRKTLFGFFRGRDCRKVVNSPAGVVPAA